MKGCGVLKRFCVVLHGESACFLINTLPVLIGHCEDGILICTDGREAGRIRASDRSSLRS